MKSTQTGLPSSVISLGWGIIVRAADWMGWPRVEFSINGKKENGKRKTAKEANHAGSGLGRLELNHRPHGLLVGKKVISV